MTGSSLTTRVNTKEKNLNEEFEYVASDFPFVKRHADSVDSGNDCSVFYALSARSNLNTSVYSNHIVTATTDYY